MLFYAVKHKLMPKERDTNAQMTFWGWLIGVLFLSALLSNWLGFSDRVAVPDTKVNSVGNTLAWVARLFTNYFTLYGGRLFFSSLIVGVFMGWAAALKIWPHVPALVLKFWPAAAAWFAPPQANQPVQTTTSSVTPAVPSQPATQADDPKRLRELLLKDMHNVALRKRYLAVRTDFQRVLDLGTAAWWRVMGIGAAIGGVIGLVAPCGSSSQAWIKGLHHALSPLGMALLLAVVVGLALPWLTGYTREYYQKKHAVSGEIGPLPEDAPKDAAAARKQFLGE